MRSISVFLRNHSEKKRNQKTLQTFENWSNEIKQLKPNREIAGNTAIVRLDDIGDFILFRNFIEHYKQSQLFISQKVTFIGNIVWKEIFDAFDSNFVDQTIWVDKKQYLDNAQYRQNIWNEIRKQCFNTIICPSRTRPILLDDMIVLTSGASKRFANMNSLKDENMNNVSNQVYNNVYTNDSICHEFTYNQQFTSWITKENFTNTILHLPVSKLTQPNKDVVCFIGANAKSKRWPILYWVHLIKLLKHNGYNPIIAGGKQEIPLSLKIVELTHCITFVGKTTLMEGLQLIDNSYALITGDTMAAHIGVVRNKNTIILSNGVNASRFVDYTQLNNQNTHTLYSKYYLKALKNTKINLLKDFNAVSSDMCSIKPNMVFETFKRFENQ